MLFEIENSKKIIWIYCPRFHLLLLFSRMLIIFILSAVMAPRRFALLVFPLFVVSSCILKEMKRTNASKCVFTLSLPFGMSGLWYFLCSKKGRKGVIGRNVFWFDLLYLLWVIISKTRYVRSRLVQKEHHLKTYLGSIVHNDGVEWYWWMALIIWIKRQWIESLGRGASFVGSILVMWDLGSNQWHFKAFFFNKIILVQKCLAANSLVQKWTPK